MANVVTLSGVTSAAPGRAISLEHARILRMVAHLPKDASVRICDRNNFLPRAFQAPRRSAHSTDQFLRLTIKPSIDNYYEGEMTKSFTERVRLDIIYRRDIRKMPSYAGRSTNSVYDVNSLRSRCGLGHGEALVIAPWLGRIQFELELAIGQVGLSVQTKCAEGGGANEADFRARPLQVLLKQTSAQ
jgi:hypothetical protein